MRAGGQAGLLWSCGAVWLTGCLCACKRIPRPPPVSLSSYCVLTCNATPRIAPAASPRRPPRRRVLRKWVSRFDLWPYLERFTIDATKEILAEIGGKPDFIIGNYRWAGGRVGGY